VAIDEGLESGGVLPCFISYVGATPPSLSSSDGGIERLRVGDPEGLLAPWLPAAVPGVAIEL
jgi:hypothetical protein